jgi:hypothetical protein
VNAYKLGVNMKTFSQLKRDMHEGVRVKTVLNNYKPERNGQIRKIAKVQTNAICFEIPQEEQHRDIFGNLQVLSYFWWDKASNYEYDGDTVKVFCSANGQKELAFIYQIMGE